MTETTHSKDESGENWHPHKVDEDRPPKTSEAEEWDLSGDRGLHVQQKAFDRLSSDKSAIMLVLSGYSSAGDLPLTAGRTREELIEDVEFLGCMEEELALFYPEMGQSIHDWDMTERDRLLTEMDEPGVEDSRVNSLSMRLTALRLARSLLINIDKDLTGSRHDKLKNF